MNTNLEAIKTIARSRDEKFKQERQKANNLLAEQQHLVRQKSQQELIEKGFWQTCLNCHYFVELTVIAANLHETKTYKHCSMYQAVPPPEVIVHGCKDWEDDIPF